MSGHVGNDSDGGDDCDETNDEEADNQEFPLKTKAIIHLVAPDREWKSSMETCKHHRWPNSQSNREMNLFQI